MKYTKLGNSQLRVSRICMGCMGFGDAANGQHSWTLDEEYSREIIKRGLELGINFFDTAIGYQSGTSEQYLGRALRDFAKREDVVLALEAIVDPVSLYEPVYSDGGDTICVMDQVKDQKNTDENWLEQIALKEAMDRLSDREKHILRLRFFEGKTQMEVSARIGISQAQISRLEKNAIQKIKREL